ILLPLLLPSRAAAPAAAWDLVPLPAQVAAAVVIADLGAWLAHRWMHKSELGWRIHQVHHSATALHVLAAARTHPLNAALTSGAELTPLVLLGLPPDALACWTVIKVVNGLLQHSNVAIDPGWLGEVLATAEAHRWHHSAAREESDTNFGNTTVLWDRLAGTRLAPTDRRPGADVGVPGPGDGYLDHLLAPLRPPPVAVDGRARAE
ncbi:MAG TPA: sterol desaturase family protein, partial [Myxococcota bacterium]|nr:sterol desaturase family protein [Myxococcota bacterium]